MANGNGISNGKALDAKFISVMVTILLAAAAAGVAWGTHTGDRSIHTPIEQKQALARTEVDRAIDREVLPRLKEIQRRLEGIETQLNRIHEDTK